MIPQPTKQNTKLTKTQLKAEQSLLISPCLPVLTPVLPSLTMAALNAEKKLAWLEAKAFTVALLWKLVNNP